MQEANIAWLLEGDVSIQYQTYRDLLDTQRPDLQLRIVSEGWGSQFLTYQNDDGHWGKSYYNPKWISTHYTLLTFKNMGIDPQQPAIHSILRKILYQERSFEPKVKEASKSILYDDVCVNGMFLNFASYFLPGTDGLMSIIDYILSQQMTDGGFNCQKPRKGARHSSLHSTISVLEGLHEYLKQGGQYRKEEAAKVIAMAEEFILMHQLYLSDRTGEIIKKDFLKFPYPCRWRYDILRAMDYFQNAARPFDARMRQALEYILSRRTTNNRWRLNAKYSGLVYFEMEKAGKESRINTLRALRVLKTYVGDSDLDVKYANLLRGNQKY